MIAFARGRNEYLSGSVCEAYPEVREYWLDWVGQCIAAGVDGVDVRISCHSSWTNDPEKYGFNEPVAREYQRRYGANPDTEPYDPDLLGKLRGEFFDMFLRAAKTRLSAAGKRLSVHAEMESFRPDACQGRTRSRPGNIEFDWRGWLSSGLADEATLFSRAWDPDVTLADGLVLEMLGEAKVGRRSRPPEPPGRTRRHVKAGQARIRLQERKAGRVLLLRNGSRCTTGRDPWTGGGG